MKYKLMLLIGLVSLMVIIAGCGLTPGESLAGNAKATGRGGAQYKAPQQSASEKAPRQVQQVDQIPDRVPSQVPAEMPSYQERLIKPEVITPPAQVMEKTYCLEHYEYISNPGDKSCMGMLGGEQKGYVCKAKPFPNDKKNGACPEGTKGSFYSETTYDCINDNSFVFKACIEKYTLQADQSESLINKNGGQVGSYYVRCEINNLLVDWQEPGHSIACGNSGAKAQGKAMLEGGDGYCCMYPK